MNNDVVRLSHGSNGTQNMSNTMKTTSASNARMCANNETMDSTMEFLKNMGCVKVNMDSLSFDKSVRAAMESFFKNPELAQEHVDFCDSLVAQGYTLEEAIEKSDKFFGILKDKNIYS